MNQSFFIGALGAHQQQKRMTIQGNNIANLNTYGYKAIKGRFTALMNSSIRGADNPEIPVGTGTAIWTTDTDFSQAPYVDTGRDQDYMIAGDGFFAVVDLTTNEVSLTRNGAFVVSELQRATGEVEANGTPVIERVYYLSDNQGRFVLSTTGGMILVDNPKAEQPVGIFDYVNYNGMEHLDGTRFMAVEKNGGIRVATGKLIHGKLEMSNADLAEEMSKVIEAQRAYGIALKMVQTSDEIESTINNLRS